VALNVIFQSEYTVIDRLIPMLSFYLAAKEVYSRRILTQLVVISTA